MNPKKSRNNCKACGAECPYRNYVFCSHQCNKDYEHNQYITRWKQGLENGICFEIGMSTHIRRYILQKFNEKCCKCGWHEVNPFSGKIPVQINHIDGNCRNNREENLELLCPNCHSLTPTHGILNKKLGRRKIKQGYRQQYQLGTAVITN